MARLRPAGFPETFLPLRGLGSGAGALLTVVAFSPAGALAIPIGPLEPSNNALAPKASYQGSRIGVSDNCKTSSHPIKPVGEAFINRSSSVKGLSPAKQQRARD